MKNVLLICLLGLFGCNNGYKVIDTKIIKGKVSAIEEGRREAGVPTLPKLYVQDNKHTFEVDIPFANENDYKVGDSITLIIQQVEEFKKKLQ
jgi:Zn-finger domain-containing protein